MPLTPGSKLGHFEITAALGEGGMGEVYRARDEKLGRDVAIKVIRGDALESAERRERFIREAKAAAALNHPNIATIYEIDEASGLTFIAMELIEGVKLSDRIASRNLRPERAIEIGIDVAEGLDHAHAKHIVHRDLKPANIMILTNGRAKIIDFGLAKLLESQETSGTEAETATKGGTLIGTVAYMSPEQARSKDVDHRSDLFSFGVILHEMLTGKKPFAGLSAPETMSAIINEPAPRLPPGLASYQPILDRCLAKEAAARYQSAGDVADELRNIDRKESPRKRINPWALAAAGAIVLALVFFRPDRDATSDVPRLSNPTLVTRAEGVEDYPAWSPDGETIAYAASRNPNPSRASANWDIWVAQVRGQQPLNRTADHLGDDRFPSWSPDGSQIAFWSSRNDGGMYIMPALAGAARRLTAAAQDGRLQWSADGGEFAYVVLDEPPAIEIVSVSTGETRRITPRHSDGIFDLAWSPNGQFFAFIHAPTLFSQITQLVVLRVSDGEELELTDGLTNVWSPAWRGDHTLGYVSNRGGPRDLWQQRLDDYGEPVGEPARITTGDETRSAMFSKDGRKLAYSKGRQIANVWRVPILADRPATWNDAEQITFEQAFIEFLDLSPDGTELALSSDRLGNPDLWIVSTAGGEVRPVTTDAAPDWHPSYSPDGKEIVFYAYRSGNRDLWIVPTEGGPARQLTNHLERDSYPVWSPDGTRIAFDSFRGGSSDIWLLTVASGELEQLTKTPGFERAPAWSPDGRWVVFDEDNGFSRVPAGGGNAERLGAFDYGVARFSPDGRRLYVSNIADGGTGNVWEIVPDTASASARAVTNLAGRPGGLQQLGLATDGQHIYFTWMNDIGDVWVADLVERE